MKSPILVYTLKGKSTEKALDNLKYDKPSVYQGLFEGIVYINDLTRKYLSTIGIEIPKQTKLEAFGLEGTVTKLELETKDFKKFKWLEGHDKQFFYKTEEQATA